MQKNLRVEKINKLWLEGRQQIIAMKQAGKHTGPAIKTMIFPAEITVFG
jgi:hypothetical protein